MSPGEAHRLTLQLLSDPSSHVYAAMADWDYPLTREGLMLADLWDLTWQSTPRKGKFKPHPRPYPDADTKRLGKTSLPPDQVKAILARVGPPRLYVTADGRARPATTKQLAYWTRGKR